MALFVAPALIAADDTQEALLNEVKATKPVLVNVLSKWKAVKVENPLTQKANDNVVSELDSLVKATTALEQYESVPVVPPAVLSLLWNDWRDLKKRMVAVGVQPIEVPQPVAQSQAPSGPNNAVAPASKPVSTKPEQPSSAAQPVTAMQPNASSQPSSTASAKAGAEPKPAEAGTPPAAKPQPPQFPSPDISAKDVQFIYTVDATPFQRIGSFQGGCTFGKGGVTADARLWTVLLSLDAHFPVGYTLDSGGLFVEKGGIAYVPLLVAKQDTHLLLKGRIAYTGTLTQKTFQPLFKFEDRNMNEVTDLLQALRTQGSSVVEAFLRAEPQVFLYPIVPATGSGAEPGQVIFEVFDSFGYDPAKDPQSQLLAKLSASAGLVLTISHRHKGTTSNLAVKVLPPIAIPYQAPAANQEAFEKLPPLITAIANLGVGGKIAPPKTDNQPAGGPTDSATEGNPTKLNVEFQRSDVNASGQIDSTKAPHLEIGNSCFHISVVPGLNNGVVQPSGSFSGQIAYLPTKSIFSLTLNGEGEKPADLTLPMRLQFGGDLSVLTKPSSAGWQFTGGAVGSYALRSVSKGRLDEWQIGGRAELQTPLLTFFPARGGSNQKPTFTLDAVAAGGSGSTTTNTNFLLQSAFTYTLQPTDKIFLDFNATGGWSNAHRFANRTDFWYVNFQGRYTVYGDWDFIALYQCGDQSPNYLHYCKWQTGFGMKTK